MLGENAMSVSPVRVGLVIGLLIALWHAAWSVLVFAGLAQKLLDFIFWAHFLTPAFHVEGFEPIRAAILIGVTFAVGFVVGFIGAVIWNFSHSAHA
jgi:hypothetical protein